MTINIDIEGLCCYFSLSNESNMFSFMVTSQFPGMYPPLSSIQKTGLAIHGGWKMPFCLNGVARFFFQLVVSRVWYQMSIICRFGTIDWTPSFSHAIHAIPTFNPWPHWRWWWWWSKVIVVFFMRMKHDEITNYSDDHVLVITGYNWVDTFYKWGYKYL